MTAEALQFDFQAPCGAHLAGRRDNPSIACQSVTNVFIKNEHICDAQKTMLKVSGTYPVSKKRADQTKNVSPNLPVTFCLRFALLWQGL